MEYRRLPLSCECGGEPKQIASIGLSADREIVIHWRCRRCGRNVCVVKPLAECWSDCFPGRVRMEPETAADRRFLNSIGVKCGEDS